MKMEFSDWITKKYIEWRGNAIGQDRSITEFSALLNVPQSLMSQWMKQNGKKPTSQKYISALITKYGIEVYDVLGIPRSPEEDLLSELPDEYASAVRSALQEIRSSGINKGKETASPDDIVKINAILEKHLGKYLVHGTEQ